MYPALKLQNISSALASIYTVHLLSVASGPRALCITLYSLYITYSIYTFQANYFKININSLILKIDLYGQICKIRKNHCKQFRSKNDAVIFKHWYFRVKTVL